MARKLADDGLPNQPEIGGFRSVNETEIRATPYSWRDPATIPPRPWIMGRWLLRKAVTAVIAPGGVGKSTLIASSALSLASGQHILGKTLWEGPQRAWIWNLEDDQDELDRSIAAAAMAHRICKKDCADRLFVDSGLTGRGLCVAVEGSQGFKILKPEIEALKTELRDRRIDVLFVDPFVSSHGANENSNGSIDAIVKMWAKLASDANCAICLVHHSRKLNGDKVTTESSRGAVALTDATRVAIVLNRMQAEEANRWGVQGAADRLQYFSARDDKHSRGRAENADWFRLGQIQLANGDEVGVALPWTPPDPFDDVTVDDLRLVQREIAAGGYRENIQADDWAGEAVARVLGLDLANAADKAKASYLLKAWVANGSLKVIERKDDKRKPRKFIEVGRPAL